MTVHTNKPLPAISPFQHTLQYIANTDVHTLVKKDAEYGSSWKKRGGVGAFMMLARKWDRLETQVTDNSLDNKWDIFEACEHLDPASGESVLETIRDLRRYLLLVESEIELRKQTNRGGTPPLGSLASDYDQGGCLVPRDSEHPTISTSNFWFYLRKEGIEIKSRFVDHSFVFVGTDLKALREILA